MSAIKKATGRTKARKSTPSAHRGESLKRGAGRSVSSPRSTRTRGARGKTVRRRQEPHKVVKVGLHFGDSKTRVAASENGDPVRLERQVFTNIVGFLRLHAPLS